MSAFAADAAAGTLPAVSFVDPSAFATQTINGHELPDRRASADRHPRRPVLRVARSSTRSATARAGTTRSSFFTYDEHGGFYDHVTPPPAPQGGALTPDGIAPGQCADLSNPPASAQPGGGANCNHSPTRRRAGHLPGLHADRAPTRRTARPSTSSASACRSSRSRRSRSRTTSRTRWARTRRSWRSSRSASRSPA